MKEWLGITDDITSWSDLLDTRLGSILKTVGLIGVGIATWKVTKGFMDAIAALNLLLSSPSYTIAVGITLAIVGFTTLFDGLESAVEDGLDGFNFGEIIGGGLLTTGGAAILGSKIVNWIGTIGSTKVVFALAEMGKNLGITTAGGLGAALASGIVGIVAGMPAYFVGIYDACKNGIDWLSGLLIPAGATAAGAGIGVIIGALGGPIGAGLGALIGLAVGAITDLVIWIEQEFGVFGEFFTGIKEKATGVWEDIKTAWSEAYPWFSDNVIKPVGSFFSGMWKRISQVAEGCWLIIRAVWSEFSDWATTWLSVMWVEIKYWAKQIVTFFDEKIITPLTNAFKTVCDKIGGFFSDLWKGIKDDVIVAMNAIITAIEWALNKIVSGANILIEGFNKLVHWAADVLGEDWGGVDLIPTVSLKRIEIEEPTVELKVLAPKKIDFSKYENSLSRYADGGFPAQGQMFIAREAGAEMVGSIGRRTAVVNNDQIVESVSNGVAVANEEQNALLREQNSLLRAMLEKETNTYIDGKKITKTVEKHQRERGMVLVTGGAY
jgi:hypothetical protein